MLQTKAGSFSFFVCTNISKNNNGIFHIIICHSVPGNILCIVSGKRIFVTENTVLHIDDRVFF